MKVVIDNITSNRDIKQLQDFLNELGEVMEKHGIDSIEECLIIIREKTSLSPKYLSVQNGRILSGI